MKTAKICAMVGIAFFVSTFLSACSNDSQNKIARTKMEYLDGNYTVTYDGFQKQQTWNVVDDKVTTVAEKGYYFFWAMVDGKKVYVQAPIDKTTIQETAN